MSIEPQLQCPKLQGWHGQIWELGWLKLDPTSHSWSYLPLTHNSCDPHELTAALNHKQSQAKREETP